MTRQKERFTTRPETPNSVQMYVCGVTVYDYSHIGEPPYMMQSYRTLADAGQVFVVG